MLSTKVGKEKLFVLDKLEISEPRTKTIATMLANMGLDRAVIIDAGLTDNAKKSIRNIKGAKYLEVSGLNVFDILKYRNVILTRSAVSKVEEVYG